DRATSFLGFPISEPPIHSANGRSEIRSLYGMTERPFEDLVVLARSWSEPPDLTVVDGPFDATAFDRSERAWHLARAGDGDELDVSIAASDRSPLVNAALVIENWGDAAVLATVDGRTVPRGADFRYGYVNTLDGVDLVVWLRAETTAPTRIKLEGKPDAN
ncbi:MAG: hypothetical protein AAFZ07_30215, partial [Actinomycetota bacterium]